MKRRFRFATADFDFCSLQLSLVAGGVVNFFVGWKCDRGRGRIYARDGSRSITKVWCSLPKCTGRIYATDRDQENQWRGL